MNNFEDPRVFYVSRTKGWVVPNDAPGVAPVAEPAARGARFYAHVAPLAIDPALAAWLAANATLVEQSAAGAIYRLASPSRTK